MLAVAMIGVLLRLRGRLFEARWFHKLLLAVTPIGIIAIWGGWVTAETGRQPWIVNGQLRTADAVSSLKPWAVLASLIMFVAIYLALLGTYAWFVARVVRQGPGDDPISGATEPRDSRRPLIPATTEPAPGAARAS
jgi:cytochrome d ubiquinol oxidase subunit I